MTILKWIRKYAVLFIILGIFAGTIGNTVLNGMPPTPQLPPDGYVVERGHVSLQWHRGTIDSPIQLQISSDSTFETLLLEKEVSGTSLTYRTDLTRGQTYYWRLIQEDKPARTSRFSISEQHVNL